MVTAPSSLQYLKGIERVKRIGRWGRMRMIGKGSIKSIEKD
jgi:hypothetical protein